MVKKFRSPFYFLCLFLVVFIFFLPPIDTDLGWHLRYGEYFLKTLSIPRTNFLTYFLPGYYWQNSYLLYQVFISLIYKASSLLGLSLACSALMALIFILFDLIHPKLTKINLALFLIFSYTNWFMLFPGIRAQLFSILYLVLELYILKRSLKNRNLLYLVPPLLLIWANTHGAFVFGIITLATFIFSELILKRYKGYIFFGFILCLSLLATLINPYSFGIYEEGIRHFIVPMNTLIAEWLGPKPIQIYGLVFLFILSLYIQYKNGLKNNLFYFLLSIFFIVLSFKAKRNLPFYVITISLFLISSYESALDDILKRSFFNTILILFPVASLMLIALSSGFNRTIEIDYNINSYCTKGMLPYPCRAIDFIKKNNLKGKNVFTSYEWGGFVEWKLPEYKYFVDGRTPAWKTPNNESPYTSYLNLIQARPGYNKTFDSNGTDFLLLGAGTFLDADLINSSGSPWIEIFRDKISVIYIRKSNK
jgi:hypothetical protein